MIYTIVHLLVVTFCNCTIDAVAFPVTETSREINIQNNNNITASIKIILYMLNPVYHPNKKPIRNIVVIINITVILISLLHHLIALLEWELFYQGMGSRYR